jgi:hypothetical protein
VIALSLAAIERGARAAGRKLDDLDVWWFAKTSLADTRAAAIEPIRMALAASANHAFRPTLEGKAVPPDLHEKIRALQREYNAHHHEIAGAANAGPTAGISPSSWWTASRSRARRPTAWPSSGARAARGRDSS